MGREDKCIVSGCNRKTLNYTGIVIDDSKHMKKMQELMSKDNYIDLFNNCKVHWLMLMNEDGA